MKSFNSNKRILLLLQQLMQTLIMRVAKILDEVHLEKALDDAFVAPANRLEFKKGNLRLKTDIKPKEATFQVALDALALTSFYQAYLITTEALLVSIHLEKFFRFAPKIPGQRFEDLPLEHEILSFIRDLGHTGDIHYLTDVSIDYLHQPWRAFATNINKCLIGKDTAYEKIRLWGIFYNKNIDYVYLIWKDFLFQIENKENKKTNKMLYPRFTKVIIDYFMSRDQSISKRNKMFWHTARDDTMFTTMRCISRHEQTQVYGVLLPQHLTSQAMLESEKTYYAYASGEKTPKPKYVRKKANSDTSPKKKPTQATKAEQLKLATKRSKTQFHSSHISSSGDGVDTQSKVPDEQQQKVPSTNKEAGVRPEVFDVPQYDSESDEEFWTFSQDEEDADE
nr:hypothetical protein [Tanacetum cinerariifolium]